MTSSEQLIYHESLDCALKVAYIDPTSHNHHHLCTKSQGHSQ